MWHRHFWETMNIDFTPPTAIQYDWTVSGPESRQMMRDYLRRTHEGVSNVFQKCKTCGKLNCRTFYGQYKESK
jgi:hypothetical protein